ncbi:uncharacterized protein [Nicotiana sylvestris]|uniref:uncharacterized protein n=1 Tax=Nicotiana sylvestris TaxID=4096 RepID=UPI00388CA797
MQGLVGQVSVAYKDLCLFPYVQLPVGFKMPKFDLYDGHGDPVAHLRGFCSKMRGADGKEELLMAYFSMNRLSLTKIEKKPSESFRGYGFRWREQAARVDPPMKERKMADYFLQALEPTYFGYLVSSICKSFNKAVKMGDMVEEGLKSNEIMSYLAIKATTQAIQNGTGGVIGKKKKEDVLDMLRPIESKLPNPPPKNLDYSVSCEYCSGTPGHEIEKCWHLKNAIQELINTNRIEVQTPEAPNINQSPLPTHHETNMIEIVHKGGEPKNPSQTVMIIRSSKVKPVKKSTVEGSVKKLSRANSESSMLVKEGSPSDVAAKQEKLKVVMPGAENNPIIIIEGAHTDPVIIKPVTLLPVISTKAIPWSYERVIVTYKGKEVKEEVNEAQGLTCSGRCFASEELRKAKTSRDNPVLVKKVVTEEEAEEFFEKNEGTRLLHRGAVEKDACSDFLTVIVNPLRRASANICPLSTLNKLKVDDERIRKNNICVWGFDGGGKDLVGDIVLELTIGPMEFTMEFQVEDDKGPWIYQVFEIVSVEKIPEGKCVPTPKITSASVMVAFEMLKNGFVPGKGLGASLQGIIHPVSLPENFGTFSLGFKPTATYVKSDKMLK